MYYRVIKAKSQKKRTACYYLYIKKDKFCLIVLNKRVEIWEKPI